MLLSKLRKWKRVSAALLNAICSVPELADRSRIITPPFPSRGVQMSCLSCFKQAGKHERIIQFIGA